MSFWWRRLAMNNSRPFPRALSLSSPAQEEAAVVVTRGSHEYQIPCACAAAGLAFSPSCPAPLWGLASLRAANDDSQRGTKHCSLLGASGPVRTVATTGSTLFVAGGDHPGGDSGAAAFGASQTHDARSP